MAEYISREGAVDEFEQCNAKNPQWTPQRVKTLLLRIPAADVAPVVRCKDCKYNRGSKKCLNPDSFFAVPKDDDFCSYGERKEGGAE